MNTRQQSVLRAIVKQHIQTAKPVGSSLLSQHSHIHYSPATIRNDMMQLEKQGFIFQPHTSAGRVPTDKGYRFYVDHLQITSKVNNARHEKLKYEFQQLKARHAVLSNIITRMIAEKSRNVALDFEEPSSYPASQSGLSYLLQNPEFQDSDKAYEIADLLENIGEVMTELFNLTNGDTHTLTIKIGSENCVKQLKDCSIIIQRYTLPDHRQGMIAILGPTRMRYDHNIRLLEQITAIVSSSTILFLILFS